MGIKFLINQSEVNTVRPQGYRYPIGLSFGIKNRQDNAAIDTTGGTQTIDGDNVVHSFTTSDTFTPNFTFPVELFMIGGGGGAAAQPYQQAVWSGAGAGGLIYISDYQVAQSNSYYCEVGAGGASNLRGGNTKFANTYICDGGGGNGQPGGCGGGPGISTQNTYGGLGYGTPGGTNSPSPGFVPGQGGGGGGVGQAGRPGPTGGYGGQGLWYSISGANTGYGGGSGGTFSNPAASPGQTSNPRVSGGIGVNIANRGSGGSNASGSSGVIILRYPLLQDSNGYFLE